MVCISPTGQILDMSAIDETCDTAVQRCQFEYVAVTRRHQSSSDTLQRAQPIVKGIQVMLV